MKKYRYNERLVLRSINLTCRVTRTRLSRLVVSVTYCMTSRSNLGVKPILQIMRTEDKIRPQAQMRGWCERESNSYSYFLIIGVINLTSETSPGSENQIRISKGKRGMRSRQKYPFKIKSHS